jgi:hypothetical protein
MAWRGAGERTIAVTGRGGSGARGREAGLAGPEGRKIVLHRRGLSGLGVTAGERTEWGGARGPCVY